MTERVRVKNVTSYSIGLVTLNGLSYNIRPNLFMMMNREDVEYNMALAPSLFEAPAQLVVVDEELNLAMGIEKDTKVDFTAADAEKILNGKIAKLKAFIDENMEKPHVLEILCDTASKMDLAVSKINVLQEAFPLRDFSAK